MKSKPLTDTSSAPGAVTADAKSMPDTKPRNKRRGPTPAPGTREANKLAVAILDVLAGARLPSQAAEVLGISLPRYYQLEQRALAAIVQSCEPRTKGPPRNPERKAAQLERQIGRLTQELSRQQALVRAAQRTIGLAPPAPIRPAGTKGTATDSAAGPAKSKSKRRRKPTVRALKAAQRLREAVATDAEPAAVGTPTPSPSLESTSHVNLPPAVPAAHSL